MRRFLAPLLLLSVAVTAQRIEAPITRVTLYPGSATIERSAQVTAGARLLEVGGLPANFDTKTLQVQADKGVRVGQIVIQDASGKSGVRPREKALKKTILELKDRLGRLTSSAVGGIGDRLSEPSRKR